MRIVALLILLAGCGDIHVTSDPVIVEHRLDMSQIQPMCEKRCVNDINPDACIIECIDLFLALLTGVSVK